MPSENRRVDVRTRRRALVFQRQDSTARTDGLSRGNWGETRSAARGLEGVETQAGGGFRAHLLRPRGARGSAVLESGEDKAVVDMGGVNGRPKQTISELSPSLKAPAVCGSQMGKLVFRGVRHAQAQQTRSIVRETHGSAETKCFLTQQFSQ